MKRINYLLIIFSTVYTFETNLSLGQIFDKEPDKRLSGIPESLKDSTRANPEKFLPVLTDFLTFNVVSEFEKVKVIHDWITTEIRYDTEPYLRYTDLVSETYEVLRKQKGICVGYSNLFNKMCTYANIESVSIVGVAKPAYITEEFLPEKYTVSNHMWNAAKISGKWYLIDLTWDAGYTIKGDFVFKYSTNHLFADPDIFITHHFPEDGKWQLLKNPVTWSVFRKLEFVEPTEKLSLTKTTIKGGINFSRLYNLNIPDITETKGFNISLSVNKGITNDLAMEVELAFDHMSINQDLSSFISSPYFINSKSAFIDPFTRDSLEVGSFSFEKIGVGLNLKYHFQNETTLLPFLKTGLSVSTPFSLSSDERGMITRDAGSNGAYYDRLHKVRNFGFLNQILYGVLISTGVDLVRKERSKNDFLPVLGIELRWSFVLNSIKLFEDYDEGQNKIKSYSINLMLYL